MTSLPDPVADALRELATLDRTTLAERWTHAFGAPAPARAQVPLLRAALAWHAQVAATTGGPGGVARERRRLRRATQASSPTIPVAAGTRLLREWQGHTHHVTVREDGFEYAGQTYRSLSAIARAITGTAWSGPRFFGLRP